jgi:addiction module HigA family antidote
VSRNALSRVVNLEAGISPEMAVRVSKAFGGSAGIWLRMQAAYDLAQVMKNEDKIKVKELKAA